MLKIRSNHFYFPNDFENRGNNAVRPWLSGMGGRMKIDSQIVTLLPKKRELVAQCSSFITVVAAVQSWAVGYNRVAPAHSKSGHLG